MWDWIVIQFETLVNAIYNVYVSIKNVLFDIPPWILDQVLTLANTLLTSVLSILEPIDISQYLGALPSEVSWTLSMVGIPQCLVIISTAIVVRLLLQLIPFTRLGS
ncbi:VSK receptor [Vibrio parahaemolyticus]|nr:VSK receptor [Vibrio parahaemolyticus]